MVQLVTQSQFDPMVDNHDNICDVNGSSLVKNLDGGVSMLVESDFLIGMHILEDVTSIVNSLQDLQ